MTWEKTLHMKRLLSLAETLFSLKEKLGPDHWWFGWIFQGIILYYGDVIMGAIASPLFTRPFIQAQIKENTKAPRHWPLCGEFTGDRWIPRGKCFHLMTSSWNKHKRSISIDSWWPSPQVRKGHWRGKRYHVMTSSCIIAVNSSPPTQNGRHFTDDIFRCIFGNEKFCILIKISLKSVPNGLIDNNTALVQVMAWRRPGDKPLSGPMMVSLPPHICVTRIK